MYRFAADENFNGRILRGFLRRCPGLAILVQCSDPAEHEGRVIFIPM